MSNQSSDQTASSVRVELFDGDEPSFDAVAAPTSPRAGNRLPIVAMGLVLAGLVGGLWWAAGFATDDATPNDNRAQLQPPGIVQPEDPLDQESANVTAPEVDGVGDDRERDASQIFVTLPADLQHVVQGPRGVLAAGTFSVDVSEAISQVPALTRTSDGRVWTSGTMQNISAGSRIVGMAERPDAAEDERILVFAAMPSAAGGSASDLIIYSSRGGADNEWAERNRFAIDGHVRTVSVRGQRWVAVVDERAQATSSVPPMRTRLTTGLVDGGAIDVEELSVAPDEFVSSFAALENGILATVIRLQLSGRQAQDPALQLRQWSDVDGWSTVSSDLTVSGQTPARVIDAGLQGVFLTSGDELLSIDQLPPEGLVAVSGAAVMNEIDESSLPELTPALVGQGYLIVDNVVGDTTKVWVSLDGVVWRRVDLIMPLRDVTLLRISNGIALLSGTQAGETGVLRLQTTGPLPLDVRARELADGEWATPVFSTAHIDDSGFVGLTSRNGRIDLIESSDGFTIDDTTTTNFPFGYFANDMETTAAGYHVVGQLGLIEDAVFTSDDGVAWERFPIDRPNSATALQIDHFHRGARSAAMVGSLGWADDLSRTERVVLWWDGDGNQITVPARPCRDDFEACTISSVLAVDEGLLVTHSRDRSTAVSVWTEVSGWQSLAEANPNPPGGATFSATNTETAWLLGDMRVLRSDDAGRSWAVAIEASVGQQGRFIGVSSSGSAAVFQTAETLWFLSSQQWTAFEIGDIVVGQLLAITDDAALLSGVATQDPERSSVVIRLAAPGAR